MSVSCSSYFNDAFNIIDSLSYLINSWNPDYFHAYFDVKITINAILQLETFNTHDGCYYAVVVN